MSRITKGYLIAMIAVVVWSATGPLVGFLITHYKMAPLLIAFWRNAMVGGAMAIILLLMRPALLRIERARVKFYMFYGLVLAVFNSVWILSVQANGAAVATVLAYSSAGFTALLAWWILKERLRLPKIIAIAMSLIGCVLVSNAYDPAMWNLNPFAILAGLASGILFAGYNLLGKEAAKLRLNAWTSLMYSFGFASVFTFLFNLIPSLPGSAGSLQAIIPILPVDGWLMLLGLSLIPTLVGFGMYNTSMNYLEASTASLIATAEPALTAILAYIFLSERLTVIQVIGSAIILSAVVIVSFERDDDAESGRVDTRPILSGDSPAV